MLVNMHQRWEMGSEFDWSNEFLIQSASEPLLPNSHELFSTATAALLGISRLFQPNSGQRLRLHMPSFYCMKIAYRMQSVYEVIWYRDIPGQPGPDFDTLKPRSGDLVLAANLFGIRSGESWHQWIDHNDGVIVIEDHTHDPFSRWALQSNAHYAVASLRKTLPIPDGGIIWSPKSLKLPVASAPESTAANKRLTAMLLKRAYLSGVDIDKSLYRDLDVKSQDELFYDDCSSASFFTKNILNHLRISKFRSQRAENVKYFIDLSLANPHSSWTSLFTSWPTAGVPFNSIICCQTKQIRDSLQQHLIHENIFAPIHWPQPKMNITSNDFQAIELAETILTIPTDHRYSIDDVARVFEIISHFFRSVNPS
jgi:hypothetical protein